MTELRERNGGTLASVVLKNHTETVTTRTWQSRTGERLWPRKALHKKPTHDCRCGQIKARTKYCAKGSNRCGGYCRHCRRRRSGHEVNWRPERPDAENRGERAVWKKQNEDGQDRAKEKTLSTKASKFERPLHASSFPCRGIDRPSPRVTHARQNAGDI